MTGSLNFDTCFEFDFILISYYGKYIYNKLIFWILTPNFTYGLYIEGLFFICVCAFTKGYRSTFVYNKWNQFELSLSVYLYACTYILVYLTVAPLSIRNNESERYKVFGFVEFFIE